MQKDKTSARPWWIVAAVTVFGSALLCRVLIRSGTIAEGQWDSWWGRLSQMALTAAAAGLALYFLHRAYRR
ncbi:hypothetical protein QLQ12_31205 [Actinoplanes sp. NEAU-A12]|uniref:Uncharacterized protein n=1 Tax=Actinoplanes sandaracinus TaxID=3045177 RepID=A0ABT6WTM5_9ACTN|nr:hypothetical protein [Actinoplanes sandaracinus]MDI6103092.1 hypothetical protein [Actinoplanes sandaracinus]